jgi:DNA-binding FadR family transcriptional regulator
MSNVGDQLDGLIPRMRQHLEDPEHRWSAQTREWVQQIVAAYDRGDREAAKTLFTEYVATVQH